MASNESMHFVSVFQFGPNGYPFAINSNGYVVFHPKLDTKVSNHSLKKNLNKLR